MFDNDMYISPSGLKRLLQVYDAKDPTKNIQWTVDKSVQLPIKLTKDGPASIRPTTLSEQFIRNVEINKDKPAQSWKQNGIWKTINFSEYYNKIKSFARSMISLQIKPTSIVNINGFNSPQWSISFYGSIFADCIPVGVYITNGLDACHYIADHSQAELIIVQGKQTLLKYYSILDKLPRIKAIVAYNMSSKPESLKNKNNIYSWDEFLNLADSNKKQLDKQITKRLQTQFPGSVCTFVYTSGTTGPPKAVMLSHDNYTWLCKIINSRYGIQGIQQRILSYLPLSHVAAQLNDIAGPGVAGMHVFYADSTALQGSLINYLKQVRPTIFFSVPRVWEKIQEKMKLIASQNGFIKSKIANWAKSIGINGTLAEIKGQPTPFMWSSVKTIVFNNVKKALGLQNARYLIFGAAPLSNKIRQYFMSLNLFLMNGYGMSQSAGPETLTQPLNHSQFTQQTFKQAGKPIQQTSLIIYKEDKDGKGEICFKGRNRFMGYYKNQQETRKTIDQNGYLHSGDIGKVINGNLYITGRLKQLIITAGGENVAPVLIQTIVKNQLPFLSNCVVIGDNRKYLSCLLTLKCQQNGNLTIQCQKQLNIIGIHTKTVKDAIINQKLLSEVQSGINRYNAKAISNAQKLIRFCFLLQDFTINNETMTPTMKLKRSIINKKFNKQIELLYPAAKL